MNLILSLSLEEAMQPRTHSRILAVFADSLQLAGKRGQLIGVSSWEVVLYGDKINRSRQRHETHNLPGDDNLHVFNHLNINQ